MSNTIQNNLAALTKPGVLSLRPGYEEVGGLMTDRPAIVATVARKQADLPPADQLPESVDGIPVDVREATPLQLVRARQPNAYGAAGVRVRPEYHHPDFDGEVGTDGKPVPSLTASRAKAAAEKPQVTYTPPAGIPLAAVDDVFTVICHASPDAGWPTLQTFLEGTATGLTVGMYDFTSAHVAQTVGTALAGKSLTMVLDHPPPNPTRDQTDEETVEELRRDISQFTFAWAVEREDPKVTAWAFPSAYHIKVAVRDSASFWLSSGNWNNSNQPDATQMGGQCDRDWHVVVNHQGLAQTFEAYLKNDCAVAANYQIANDAAVGRAQPFSSSEPKPLPPARAGATTFPARTFQARMKITPLLTPDNYAENVLTVIGSATKSFCMQTQYIHLSTRGAGGKLTQLVDALAQKIAAGVEVRLIVSQYGTGQWLEPLQQAGIDLQCVRAQQNVHNKGMVVDGKVVVLGSQNWSSEGVDTNRDASLIIEHDGIAQYYQAIFDDDWQYRAHPVAPGR